jgi:hypothetical protein
MLLKNSAKDDFGGDGLQPVSYNYFICGIPRRFSAKESAFRVLRNSFSAACSVAPLEPDCLKEHDFSRAA